MDIKNPLKIISGQLHSIRRLLQQGQSLSAAEYQQLKADIESLLSDLESHYLGKDKHH